MYFSDVSSAPLARTFMPQVHSIADIAGSNPAEAMDVIFLVFFVGIGLCDGPITRPGDSYRVFVLHRVIKGKHNPLHLQWHG